MAQATTLTDKARELLEAAQGEREELQRRKADLLSEREADVARVREQYRVRLDAVEAELELADRLWRALDPEGFKAERESRAKRNGRGPGRPPKEPTTTTNNWRPNDESLRVVLGAIVEGKDTVGQIAKIRDVSSRATVDRAVNVLREDGLIRLAGVGQYNAKKYRLTPEGHEWLTHRMTPEPERDGANA